MDAEDWLDFASFQAQMLASMLEESDLVPPRLFVVNASAY